MAESTLSLKLADLAIETGSYLGYGRTPSNWQGWDAQNPYKPKDVLITVGTGTQTVGANDTQLGHIIATVNTGLDWFYHPTIVQGQTAAYKWTFLEPEALPITTTAGIGEYALPDLFGMFDGPMTYDPSANAWGVIRQVGETFLRGLLQRNSGVTGKPTHYCVIDKNSDGALGQRKDVLFFPTPDSTYLLRAKYLILPNALTAQNPYPLGGEAHGQTIKAACLAAAENDLNDEKGIRWQTFQELLAASISYDSQNRPENLGYNGDSSDGWQPYPGITHWGWPPLTTINGLPIPQ